MRSTWMAQEILATFDEELSEVALIPGTGGIFEIKVNDKLLWSLKDEGRFPDIKENIPTHTGVTIIIKPISFGV